MKLPENMTEREWHVRTDLMRLRNAALSEDRAGIEGALVKWETMLLEEFRAVEALERRLADEAERVRVVGCMLAAGGLQSYTDPQGRIYVARGTWPAPSPEYFDRAAEYERKAVVTWLRRAARVGGVGASRALEVAADAIEAGRHRKEGESP